VSENAYFPEAHPAGAHPAERGTGSADVVVVGAGPVGLWLAAELRLAGATVTVLEKRLERSAHSRALTLHARTLELFAMRGIVGPWLDEGVQIPTTHYAMLSSRLDLRDLDSDYPFALFLPQRRTEELLEAHARRLGADLRAGVELTAIEASEDGVDVRGIDNGRPVELNAQYVVGCDGRRSIVRQAAGIGYTGSDDMPGLSTVIGDVVLEMSDPPAALTKHTGTGSFYAVRINQRQHRLIAVEHTGPGVSATSAVSFDDFRDTVVRLTGTDFAMTEPSWLGRVGTATFQADQYRKGRVLLAGDAGHVHYPMGGQGLNLGVQDAMNLGWKLGAVLTGVAAPDLLDSYESERFEVGKLVIDDTLAQTGLVAMPGREGQAMRATMTAALTDNKALNAQFALAVSGLGVNYPRSPGAPLTGARVPNLVLEDGPLYPRMADARFQLIGVEADGLAEQLGAAANRLTVAPAALAANPAPWDEVGAVLVRPDGYAAWTHARGAAASADDAVYELLRWLAK